MKVIQLNVDDWLRQEAHVATGRPFQFKDCSCVPVAPENRPPEGGGPIGFLVAHGTDVAYVPAQTPDGEQMMTAWTKNHLLEISEESRALPAECWYG